MQRTFHLLALFLICTLLGACGGTTATITTTSVPPQGTHQDAATTGASTNQNAPTPVAIGATAAAAAATSMASGAAAPQPMIAAESSGRPQSHVGGAPLPQRNDSAAQYPQPTPQPDLPPSPRNQPPYDSTYYQSYGINPFVSAAEDPQSTFAMDIDSASYTVMRRYLSDGFLPDPDSVRPEEYVNYFDYRYPEPVQGDDFAIYTETGPSPWGAKGYEMVQIGIQGRHIEAADRRPTSLTFVIDVSGSMDQENRLETVKQALALLVDQMREDDQIGIVVYGSDARSVLPVTSGAHKERILNAITDLRPDGSTNVEAGLDIGFRQASEAFVPDSSNMILLCSDGVANNGVTDPEALLEKYKGYTDKGIKLTTFGFGMGNFNDVLMERLANAGNGFYTYIDTLDEAKRVFVQNLTGTLQLIARDPKIQVEFDPAVVSHYRLVGYENRDIADQNFRNDTVDAGEVGAGHSVTALYEIRRQAETSSAIATVRIRYHKTGTQDILEVAQPVRTDDLRTVLADTTPRFKLAVSVAQYAELLRHGGRSEMAVLEDIVDVAQQAQTGFRNDSDVAEFGELLNKAATLTPNLPERTTSP